MTPRPTPWAATMLALTAVALMTRRRVPAHAGDDPDVRHARGCRPSADRRSQGRTARERRRDLRAGRTSIGGRLRSSECQPQSPDLHRRRRRGLATGRSGRRTQGARRRQRAVAVSGSAGRGRGRLAVRHGGGEGRSPRPADRPKRADGHDDLPHLRRRAAAVCRTRTRRTAGRTLRDGTPQRFLAARTGCSGRPHVATSEVRSATWWPSPHWKAARSARRASPPTPFHGYYFKILTAQGPSAPGGAASFISGGRMSGGFALVAWPAQYDSTGVMTFIVNRDGMVREKDLGAATEAAARAMTLYDPDPSWTAIQ